MEVVLVGRGVIFRKLALFLVALANRRKMKTSQVLEDVKELVETVISDSW